MAKVTYGAGPKPRKKREKDYQNTERVYGGNSGANKGKTYATKERTLNKTNTLDKLQKENKERRGRKRKGTITYRSKSTGAKARARQSNRQNRAKRGDN